MSENPNSENPISINPDNSGNANLIYILYLVNIIGIPTALVGVIMAYISKDKAPEWLISHYNNQINIFWKAVLYAIISSVLVVVVIGFLTMLLTLVWYIVRCIKGMQAISRGEPIANPGSWAF